MHVLGVYGSRSVKSTQFCLPITTTQDTHFDWRLLSLGDGGLGPTKSTPLVPVQNNDNDNKNNSNEKIIYNNQICVIISPSEPCLPYIIQREDKQTP